MVWGELRHRIRPGAAVAVALAAALVAIFLLPQGTAVGDEREVEVFDPDRERAAELVRYGRIVPIP